jgi:hypothetical protein
VDVGGSDHGMKEEEEDVVVVVVVVAVAIMDDSLFGKKC